MLSSPPPSPPGGPSVNDISEEDFVSLRANADVWGVNFLARHPFIEPDYNGLELDQAPNEYCPGWPQKKEGHCCQVPHFEAMLNQANWTDATFLIQQHWTCARKVKRLRDYHIYTYDVHRLCQVIDRFGACKESDGRYRVGRGQVTAGCCCSLQRMLDLMSYQGYRSIYLIGFDGIEAGHYWSPNGEAPSRDTGQDEAPASSEPAASRSSGPPVGGGQKKRAVHEMGKWGIEAMVSAFGVFNGIRLINLSQRSLFQPFVFTETVQQAVDHLRKRAETLQEAAREAGQFGAPPAAGAAPPPAAPGPGAGEPRAPAPTGRLA